MKVPTALLAHVDFEATVAAELSARNRYLPPPLADRALLPHVSALADRLETRMRREFEPSPHDSVLVRKSVRGSRPLPYLALEDRLFYRALVGTLDGRLPDVPGRRDHDAFVKAPLGVDSCRYVLKADVAAYYQYVDHERLIAEVVAQTGDDLAVTAVVELLQGGAGRRFGLPQMHASSDVLADVYVDPIRRDLLRRGHVAFRFVDDFRVACGTYSEALASLELIERAAFDLGLVLNEQKTSTPRRATYEQSLTEVSRAEEQLFAALAAEGLTVENFFAQAPEEYDDDDDGTSEPAAAGDEEAALLGVGDDEVDLPENGDVDIPTWPQLEVATRVISTWGSDGREDYEWSATVWSALLRKSLHTLEAGRDNRGVESAITLLVHEPHLTPQVCNYLTAIGQEDAGRVHALLDELCSRDIVSVWQSVWIVYLAGSVANASVSPDTEHVSWLRRQVAGAHDAVAAQAALALARRRSLPVEEGARAYERAQQVHRPTVALALAAAHGAVGSAFAHDDLVEGWLTEWARTQQWGRRPVKRLARKRGRQS